MKKNNYFRKNRGNIADIIKGVKGVMTLGYGIIMKYAMIDPDLSPISKLIYAYFCALCDKNMKAYPSRDTILNDLNLSKSGYYAHYNALIEQGYITVAKAAPSNIKSHNIYTIVLNPKKFVDFAEESDNCKISANDIRTYGHGFLPIAVMFDARLNKIAKLIYCYLASFAGKKRVAFPKLENILHHLNISERTYYRYYNQLVECDYVTPIQRNANTCFGVCDYYLNKYPGNPKKEESVKPVVKSANPALGQIQDIEQPTIKSGETNWNDFKPVVKSANPALGQIQDTNINSSNKNINNNNIYQIRGNLPSSYNKPTEIALPVDLIDTNLENISENTANRISFDELKVKYPDNHQDIDLLNNIIVETLSNSNPNATVRVGSMNRPIADVRPVFASLQQKHLDYVIDCLIKHKSNIKGSFKSYYATSLFNAPRTIGYYYDRSDVRQTNDGLNNNAQSKELYNGMTSDDFYEQLVRKSLKF